MKKVPGAGWPVTMFFALCMFAGAVGFLFSFDSSEAEKAQALVDGIPAPVPLDTFDRTRDVHSYDEVNIVGWIDPEYNYELTQTRRRKLSSYDTVRRIFVLFGPGDAPGTKAARAVLIVPPERVDALFEELQKTVTVQGSELMFTVNGRRDGSPDLESMIEEAMQKEGLTRAANFIYVEPWEGSREAALKPTGANVKWGVSGVMALIGAGLLLAALAGRRAKRRFKAAFAALPEHTRAELIAGEKRRDRHKMIQGLAGFAAFGIMILSFKNPDLLSPNIGILAVVAFVFAWWKGIFRKLAG